MRTRIVVANQSEARFFDTIGGGRKPVPAGTLTNPAARLHDQDLESDRPGRVFNFGGNPFRRRGASVRHGASGERSTHQHLIEKFARRVGAELGRGHEARQFDRVVLVAGPAFLGRLRRSLPAGLRGQVAAEVGRDLINQPDVDLRSYLPGHVFTGGAGFEPLKRAIRRRYS